MTTTAYDDQFAPRSDEYITERARHRVARRYSQPYHKNAILIGDWDSGTVIRDEIAAIEAEQAKCEGKQK